MTWKCNPIGNCTNDVHMPRKPYEISNCYSFKLRLCRIGSYLFINFMIRILSHGFNSILMIMYVVLVWKDIIGFQKAMGRAKLKNTKSNLIWPFPFQKIMVNLVSYELPNGPILFWRCNFKSVILFVIYFKMLLILYFGIKITILARINPQSAFSGYIN